MTTAGTAAWPERGLRLPPVGPSVPRARRYVREQLLSAVPEDVVDAAELCVSELATNSVLHAATEFVVELARSGDAVRLAVSDRSPVLPRTVPYGTTAATGRGLHLVARLSAHWGVQALTGTGKTVWCEVAGSAPELDVDDVLAGWQDELDDRPGAPAAAPAAGP
ncbi:MAG: ATP-binding protein, partial [Actinomycetota bacterium]|nr:ATP-binding protein [Actinomycetota bacterium]